MLHRSVLFTLACCGAVHLAVAQTWVVDTLLPGSSLTVGDIEFPDPLHGFACGYPAAFYRTVDGGATWNSEAVAVTLSDIEVAGPGVLYRMGDDGFVQKTTDGGDTWVNTAAVGTANTMREACFLSPDSGWVMSYDPTTYSVAMHRTTDGGASWTTLPVPTSNTVHDVVFLNDTVGFIGAMGGARIWRTQDGGQNWAVTDLPGSSITEIDFLTDSLAFAVGNEGRMYRTTDQGDTWLPVTSGITENLTQVRFTDALNGWTSGYNGVIYYTTNGGSSWVPAVSNTTGNIFGLEMIDATYGFAVADLVADGTEVLRYGTYVEQPALLKGRLFTDPETLCDSTGAAGLPGVVVNALPGPAYAITDAQGRYTLAVAPGTYTVFPLYTPNPALDMGPSCVTELEATVNAPGEVVEALDFGTQAVPCHYLEVAVASDRRRYCFRNNTTVSYTNLGVLTAPAVTLDLYFPEFVVPLTATMSYTVQPDGAWRFTLGDLAPYQGGSIYLVDSVMCYQEEILGLAQCTRAVISPPNDCLDADPGAYDGSDLHVGTACLQGEVVRFVVRNTGEPMADSTDHRLYRNSLPLAEGRLKLAAGDSLVMAFASDGNTYRLEVDQRPDHPTRTQSNATLENCKPASVAQATLGYVIAQRPDDEPPNEDIDCLEIRASYDPNDKSVSPAGAGPTHRVDPGTPLTYLVRFQNTGTDTAFTVVIRDTLSTALDLSTLRVTAASHPYTIGLEGVAQPVLVVRFADILLPDSGTNEQASHGFVQFTLAPLPGLPLGTVVHNTADIYFDFNSPIITNTASITYDVPPPVVPGEAPAPLTLPVVLGDTLTCKPDLAQLLVIGTGEPWWSLLEAPADTVVSGAWLTEGSVGSYTVLAHTAEGVDTLTFTVADRPTLYLGNDTVLCIGDTWVLDPGPYAGHLWQDGTTTPTHTVGEGWVWLTVTNAQGCSTTDSLFVVREECGTGLMETAGTPLRVVPQPVVDLARIHLPANTSASVELTLLNALGAVVRRSGPHAPPVITLDLQGLPGGAYVLLVHAPGTGQWSQRIVKVDP